MSVLQTQPNMIPSYLLTAFRIILLLSIVSNSSWAQQKSPPKSKATKPPHPPQVAPAKAKPKPLPPKTTVQVNVYSSNSEPSKEPEEEKPKVKVRRFHPPEMSFQWLASMSWNSASGSGSAALTDNFGSGLRTTVGPNMDLYFFQDRYAFGTGVWYTVKRMGYSHPPDRFTNPGTTVRTSAFTLQYLQVPLTMKLISNTLFRTGRSFIQYGGVLDFKLDESAIDYQNNYIYQRDGNLDQFTSAGLSMLLALGYMHRIKPTNDLIMTVQYQRSLTNNAIPANIWSVSQHFAFGLGLSF